MTVSGKIIVPFILLAAFMINTYAQDPVLPPTNLGGANVYDGIAGKPGFVYQGFGQVFQTRSFYDQNGQKVNSPLKINTIVQTNQLIYMSPIKVFGGYLAFTVIVPVVQISPSGAGAATPTANPAVLADIVQGTAIQWNDRKLFGKPFFHRAEFDINLPVGNYDSKYNINPAAHLWAYSAYHAFTMLLNKRVSVSARNQFSYNSHFIGREDKAGAFYNGNYSVDYSIFSAFKIEAVAYYLRQFNQDRYGTDKQYYADKFGIYNSKETVAAFGPGLAYFAPGGALIEAKVFFETGAKNRFAGSRPTIRVAIPLSK